MNMRALLTVGLLLLLGSATWLGVASTSGPRDAPGIAQWPQSLDSSADFFQDRDGDGLADAVENYVVGSNPDAWSTTDNGIPDGWLHTFGFDPSQPGIASRPAATPDAESLPEVYDGVWPSRYRWTLLDAYTAGRPDSWDETVDGPWNNGLDPRVASTTDGLPFAWLVAHSIPITQAGIAEQSFTGDGMTVRDNFLLDTDPRAEDTDGDGLSDRDESLTHGTNPRLFSTAGTGIPDGWMVAFGLDPLDGTEAGRDRTGKGMTTLEVYQFNAERLGAAEAHNGSGLNPLRFDSRADGIPDGWLLQHGLDPLRANVGNDVVQRASDYPGVRALGVAAGQLPDLAITVAQAYNNGRPAGWSEALHGPWHGGLNPRTLDTDNDGLPDAVELRGWPVERTSIPGAPESIVVASDPRRADSDNDGISDSEEYWGAATRNGASYTWTPTDPRARDTAFSGIADGDKIFGFEFAGEWVAVHHAVDGALVPVLDPVVADADADGILDGAELRFWSDASNSAVTYPYPSLEPDRSKWLAKMPCCSVAPTPTEVRQLLGPAGDIDADGLINVVDPDADDDGIPDGEEAFPAVYAAAGRPRSATDPGNRDTDGDQLPDGWERTHGRWRDTVHPDRPNEPGWDLDPAKPSSRDDGIPDGAANLDGDVVMWRAYGGGQNVDRNEFAFTNLREYEAGTNPRIWDEDGDGISEGWVRFWTNAYPLLLLNPGVVGDLVPTEAEMANSPLASQAPPFVSVSKYDASLPFQRFVTGLPNAPPSHLLRDEFAEIFVGTSPTPVIAPDGSNAHVWTIAGSAAHSFAVDQQHGLNPYLLDTDGDGLPDRWEVLHTTCRPDAPSLPDADEDPDGDGVTNAVEHAHGSDPCKTDTDHDGFDDATEIAVQLNPSNPSDGASAATSGQDSDGDGLDDLSEIQNGLHPFLVDTDADGLLDGDGALGDLALDPAVPAHQARIAALQEFGLAHRPSAGTMVFFREGSAADSVRAVSAGSTIPQGWLVYHYGTASSQPADAEAAYRCNRPAWWQEETLGVWWWGASPSAGRACTADMDGDGLNDRNGDDPVPAASRSDAAAMDSRALPQRLSATATEAERRTFAASWGDCAGHPDACASQWNAPPSRVPIALHAIQIDGVTPHSGAAPRALQPFTVAGRVATDCSGGACTTSEPVGARTVVLETIDPAATWGAGFTQSDGTFSFTACLCQAWHVNVPAAGMSLLGTATGTVHHEPGLGQLEAGSPITWRLRVLPSSGFFGGDPATDSQHPHHHAFAASGGPVVATEGTQSDVPGGTIVADSVLALDVPARLRWGELRQLTASVHLQDTLGRPLADRDVVIRLADSEVPIQTNPEGRATVTMPVVPSGRTGELPWQATFTGGAHHGHSVVHAATTVQAPLRLFVESLTTEIPSSGRVEFTVRLDSGGAPPTQDVPIRVTIGGSAVTNPSSAGRAEFVLPASSFEPGPHALRATVAETSAYQSATVQRTVHIVSGSRISLEAPGAVDRGSPFTVSGRLQTSDGQGIAAAAIDLVHLGSQHRAFTDARGFYTASLELPPDAQAGAFDLTATFAGIERQLLGASAVESIVSVVPVSIRIDAPPVSLGEPARIAFVAGLEPWQPVAGIPLQISVAGLLDKTVVTDANGHALVTVPSPPLGTHAVAARFAGSPNGSFAPTEAHSVLAVRSGITLEVPALDSWLPGSVTLFGRARDAHGEPAADVIVAATARGLDAGPARTDSSGWFRMAGHVDERAAPGPVAITLTTADHDRYAASTATVDGVIASPMQLTTDAPPRVGRGAALNFTVHAGTVHHGPVAGATIHVTGPHGMSSAVTDADGIAHFHVGIPVDAQLGDWNWSVASPGLGPFMAADLARPVRVMDGVQIRAIELAPPRDGVVDVRFQLVAATDGQPIANEPIAIRYRGGEALVLTTNQTGFVQATVPWLHQTGDLEIAFAGTDSLAPATELLASEATIIAPSTFGWQSWAATALLAVAAVILAVVAARKRIARRRSLLAGRKAYRRFHAGDPWSGVVLALYDRLVSAVLLAGGPDLQELSPRDACQKMAESRQLPADVVVELAALVDAARYGPSASTMTEIRRTRMLVAHLQNKFAWRSRS